MKHRKILNKSLCLKANILYFAASGVSTVTHQEQVLEITQN